MFLLVSEDRVRTALKIDNDESSDWLRVLISAASLAVVEYLKGEAGDFLSIDSPPNSPPDDLSALDERVVVSVIAIVGIVYREPDGDEAKNFVEMGRLPNIAKIFLYPLRVPTMA